MRNGRFLLKGIPVFFFYRATAVLRNEIQNFNLSSMVATDGFPEVKDLSPEGPNTKKTSILCGS